MKVVLSNVTLEEVKQKNDEALKHTHNPKATREIAHHLICKRLPFLIVFLQFGYYLLNYGFPPLFKLIHEQILPPASAVTGSDDSVKVMISGITALILAGCIIVVILVAEYAAIFRIAGILLPQNTPTADLEQRYLKFWRSTTEIEKVLRVMHDIAKLSPEDIQYSEIMIEDGSDQITLLLKDSKWGFIEKRVYTLTHYEMMANLRKTRELDFSYMDKEWEKLLQQYPSEQPAKEE